MNNNSVTILIPALNEAPHLEKNISDIYYTAKENLHHFEMIIVDDGSTDNTYEAAVSAANKLGPEIHIIKKEKNEGIGASFITASKHAKYEYLVAFPADGAYPMEAIKQLLLAVGQSDVILGYRQNLKDRPFLRYTLSRCITAFVSLITEKKLQDTQGTVIIPTKALDHLPMKLSKYGFQMQITCFLLTQPETTYLEIPISASSNADASSQMIRFPVLIDIVSSCASILRYKLTTLMKHKISI